MGKSKELRRQLKREKVIEGFESSGYEVIEWYIDHAKNCCVFLTVRNLANNIEFLCTIPSNFYLSSSEGVYVFEDMVNTPDVDDAISLWNECGLEKLFLRIQDKVIVRNGRHDYTVYTCRAERPDEGDLDTLERYANEMSVLNDEMLKQEGSEKSTKVVIDKRNPFDILLDGGSFTKVPSKRIEDVQPSILIEYNGYTLGQAIPVVEFLEFFNRDNVGDNINRIAKDVKTIYDFQNDHIKKLFDEAITSLENFTESVKSSYEEYTQSVDTAGKDFDTIQAILEKNTGSIRTNDIANRAHTTLRTLLMEQIEKRDAIIGFLDQIRVTFGEL